MTALDGRRVVVTRPLAQGRALAATLEARGAVAIPFPTIACRPVADPAALDRLIDELGRAAWVVFTSRHAVDHLWRRMRLRGIAAFPVGTRIAAVGPATAERVRLVGGDVSAMPDVYLGDAIAGVLGNLAGQRVLLPRADTGRPETAAALRRAGADVLDVTAYQTVPAAPDREGLDALRRGVDAITFTAPSTARNFVALVGREAHTMLAGTAIACIGPTTAREAVAIGVARPIVASSATSASLVDALERYFAAQTPIRAAAR